MGWIAGRRYHGIMLVIDYFSELSLVLSGSRVRAVRPTTLSF